MSERPTSPFRDFDCIYGSCTRVMVELETHESGETLEESRIRFGFDKAEVD